MARSLTTALAVLLGVSACAPAGPVVSAEPKQEMEVFTMTRTRNGEKIWELSSPHARIKLGGGADIEKPQIKFFKNGVHATTADAASGIVDPESNDVHLEGDVVILAIKEKTKLSTERLEYSTEDEKFRTEESVLIERPDARVRGKGLEADAALTDITIRTQETLLR